MFLMSTSDTKREGPEHSHSQPAIYVDGITDSAEVQRKYIGNLFDFILSNTTESNPSVP